MSESSDSRVVLDFEGTTGEGITLCGNYWYIQNVDVTNSANGKDGIHVCGSHNVLDTVNTYKNGTQVFRLVDIHQLRIRLIGQHIIQLRIVHLIIMQMLVMKMLMDLQLS